ncbi:MAG: hypothetical protein II334_04365 [Clostridia bacterium]|nr:hypothetical protein [Clostridia bacterium]
MAVNKKKPFSKHNVVLSLILAAVLVFYSFRMLDYQVINAATYSSQSKNAYSRTSVIKASRGEILDRYGRQLAANRNGYDIVFNRAYIERDELNDLIVKMMTLLTEYNTVWNDDLPILNKSPYSFTDDEAAKKTLRRILGVAHYATAEDCFTQLIKRYSLEGLDPNLQRHIMGVRYTMEVANFSVANPYTFASDISEELMLRISESAFMVDGISVNTVPVREYAEGTLASNIIGTVGAMNAENWEKLRDKGYSYSDKIGITGIEAQYEEQLHGTDGEITYTLDGNGNILSTEVTKAPIPGKTLILSLDKKLQQSTQDALQNLITSLNEKGGSATGGAAVAIDIKTGEVLIAANYPTFDVNDYFKKYNELSQAKNKPLTNRSLAGIYPPGSSIKPIISIAALENAKLMADERVTCTKVYKFYQDVGFTPSCMGHHGSINVVTALSRSCNYFFYEMGRRLGIDAVNSYLKQFGLGEKTGVEVYESKGIRDDAKSGWFAGNTLQVAIGQHNAFTPIQICSATATIANSGVRYKTTFVNSILSYDLSETYYRNEPQVLNQIKISDNVLDTVKRGMLSVTEDGTGSAVFGDYPIQVGGKTGTAQTDNGADHNVFVAFAPFENPEIAVAVVIEHGASSFTSGSVMRSVMDAYFFNQEETYKDEAANTPLK